MEIWMSGEIQGDVGDDFRMARTEIEKILGESVETYNSEGVKEIALIPIIMKYEDPDFDEVKKYRKSKKELEFRLKINHATFRKGDMKMKKRLIFDLFIKCLNYSNEMKIKDFDRNKVLEAFNSAAKKAGWI